MAGPEAVSVKGYVDLLGKIVGVEPQVVFVPPDMVDDAGAPSSIRYPWRRTAIFSTQKAQAHLGFHPRPMSRGMAEAYKWYLAEGLDDRPWDFSDEDSLMERLKL
jgi:nucleoside-diphosphate-sugar epimerase